jgi:anti-sigma B factor antagonist
MNAPGTEAESGLSAPWSVLPLSGDIDLVSAPDVRLRLAEATEQRPSFVVLDLGDLDFVDSTGLGVFVGAVRRVRDQGGDVRIAAARPGIERVFAITGLDRVFRMFSTVEDAVHAPVDTPAVKSRRPDQG